MRLSRLGQTGLAVLAAAGLAIGATLIAARLAPQARLDLTAQRLYTLSAGTRQTLAGLQDPITLRLFYSRRLGAQIPLYGAYHDRVRELLQEYVALAKGKLRLELFDPEPFSPLEDRALGYGLQRVPLDQGGSRSISAWSAPTRWLTNAPSPSCSRTANASWNTTSRGWSMSFPTPRGRCSACSRRCR